VSESLAELQPWMPWAQKAPLANESEALSRGAHAKFLQRTDLVYSMWAHGGNGVEQRLVGGSGLHRIDWSVPRFEIGYWCRSGFSGRGYVTEAVLALSRMAFDQLGAQRVEIRMDDRNTASWRVAERAGFRLDGVLRRDTVAVDGAVRDTRVYSRVRGVEEP
jgi:RimJ/RimL family protein N-acetyltransferase